MAAVESVWGACACVCGGGVDRGVVFVFGGVGRGCVCGGGV